MLEPCDYCGGAWPVSRATKQESTNAKPPDGMSEGFVGGCRNQLRAAEMVEPSNRLIGYLATLFNPDAGLQHARH